MELTEKLVRNPSRIIIFILSAAGAVFFIAPVYKNYYIDFSAMMTVYCLLPGVWAALRSRCSEKRKKAAMVLDILICIWAAVFIWFAGISAAMFTVDYGKAPENTTVVVLGARAYDTTVSESFSERLDAAKTYLDNNPEAICIVSGGKGNNESRSEAEAGKDYLTDKGIDAGRIVEEDQSTSTYENILFTKEKLSELGLDDRIVIATQSFHQFRSRRICSKLGVEAYSLKARTNPWLFPTYYARELMAVSYALVFGNSD
jgi:uncharacterized SAM-binding protein YcdF (DUF218 family)